MMIYITFDVTFFRFVITIKLLCIYFFFLTEPRNPTNTNLKRPAMLKRRRKGPIENIKVISNVNVVHSSKDQRKKNVNKYNRATVQVISKAHLVARYVKRIGVTFRFQVVFDGVYRYSCFSKKKQRAISQSSRLKFDNTVKARGCGRTVDKVGFARCEREKRTGKGVMDQKR